MVAVAFMTAWNVNAQNENLHHVSLRTGAKSIRTLFSHSFAKSMLA